MPLNQSIIDAIDRLSNKYNGNNYNATSNPGGLASDGHRFNFVPALRDMAEAGEGVAAFVEGLASSASDDAIAAGTARTGAETAHGLAEGARDKAQAWANAGENVEVEPGQFSAAHFLAKTTAEAGRATDEADRAQGYADGLNLPSLSPEDTGLFVRVGAGGVYELDEVSFDAVNAAVIAAQNAADAAARQGRLNALYLAEMKGDRLNMVDGIVDPYADATDINAGASSGYFFNATTKTLESVQPAIPNASPISSGATAGNPTQYAASMAFDGVKANGNGWISAQSGAGIVNVAYIGQNYGAGTAHSVVGVRLTNYSANGYVPTSIDVQFSDDGASWTTVSNFSPNVTSLAVTTVEVPGAGAHRYWRLLAKATTGNNTAWQVGELEFLAPISPMLVRSADFGSDVLSPSVARLFVQVAPPLVGAAAAVNTDLVSSVSRDGGVTFTPVTLATVEALTDGTTLYEGFADISGQPAGSSMVYKHNTANAKDVRIAGTGLQWRA